MLSPDYKAELEELFTKNGWNINRIIKSFSSKHGFEIFGTEYKGKFCLLIRYADHRAIKCDPDDDFAVVVMLSDDMSHFRSYICLTSNYFPLHDPVRVPVVYGYRAQITAIHGVVSGLWYVCKVSGLKSLKYFPNGISDVESADVILIDNFEAN